MKILLLHNSYGVPSGEERMVQRIAALLREKGHTVHCHLEEGLSAAAGLAAKAKAFCAGLYSPASVRRIAALASDFAPDLVQVQNLYPYLSPWVLPPLRERGIPVVMRCANYRLLCPNGLMLSHGLTCERCIDGREYWCLLRNCEGSLAKSLGYALRHSLARGRRLYRDNVSHYYTQTEFQRGKLIQGGFPADAISVIPNMVQPTGAPDAAPLGGYLGFVGRGSPEKGVATLLQAARLLPKIPFRLAGDFWRMPEAKREAPGNVAFTGPLHEPALSDFYRNCRMLLLPTLCYEGFPGVLIEAMQHGKPVLCSRIGGLPEIVHDGSNGLLFEPGDATDLAARAEWLWSHPELGVAMGRAGQAAVLRDYSPETYYQRLMQVYRRSLAAGAADTCQGETGVL